MRKQLLAGGAALALAGCGAKKQDAPAKPQAGLDPAYRPFDAVLFAAHDQPARDAIERHRRGLDAGAAAYLHELEAAVAEAAAAYLGVQQGELAFTDSTTMGLGLVYSGLIEPGDEVVATTHDHYATYEALRLAGAKLRRVALYDDPASATADEMLSRLTAAITPRTKVVALTWVHSSTGVRVPAERLDVSPIVVADGVHGLAATTPRKVGDVSVAGTHEWLGGPRGTGLIRTEAFRAAPPDAPERIAALATAPQGSAGFVLR